MKIEVSDDPAGALARALTERAPASVVLTGGTVATEAYRRLEWADADFWWGDERFVPEGHTDRNDQQARDAFLDRLGVPESRIHAAPAHGCDLSMAEAADHYAATLPDHFDVVLLGIGPDGHVASLFPGHPQLHVTDRRVVEVFDSPKPPAQRLSLTFPALNAADAVWFVAAGSDKAEAVARALAHRGTVEETPARGVRGKQETRWFLDPEAASRR